MFQKEIKYCPDYVNTPSLVCYEPRMRGFFNLAQWKQKNAQNVDLKNN